MRFMIKMGYIHATSITFQEAIREVVSRAKEKQGGYVVTPNVDHICLAETNVLLREAYASSALALADGVPLLWLSRLMGNPLPHKISGSDFVEPLLRACAREKLRVYFLGGQPGVGVRAKHILEARIAGLTIVGVDAPLFGFEKNESQKR